MSGAEWARMIPLAGITGTLFCFAAATFVRSQRRGRYGWPLAWGYLSALFLFSIGLTAGWGVLRIALPYTDYQENRMAVVVLWWTLLVSLWTLRRWWKDGEL